MGRAKGRQGRPNLPAIARLPWSACPNPPAYTHSPALTHPLALQVKHTFLQHLPASDVAQPEDSEDDWSIVNHVVLDNSSLEMYHSLLYGRPYCSVVRLRWRGMGSPSMVQVQRKTYKEGWRPEASIKDSFPLVEEKV